MGDHLEYFLNFPAATWCAPLCLRSARFLFGQVVLIQIRTKIFTRLDGMALAASRDEKCMKYPGQETVEKVGNEKLRVILFADEAR